MEKNIANGMVIGVVWPVYRVCDVALRDRGWT